jgi:hypothetical protein
MAALTGDARCSAACVAGWGGGWGVTLWGLVCADGFSPQTYGPATTDRPIHAPAPPPQGPSPPPLGQGEARLSRSALRLRAPACAGGRARPPQRSPPAAPHADGRPPLPAPRRPAGGLARPRLLARRRGVRRQLVQLRVRRCAHARALAPCACPQMCSLAACRGASLPRVAAAHALPLTETPCPCRTFHPSPLAPCPAAARCASSTRLASSETARPTAGRGPASTWRAAAGRAALTPAALGAPAMSRTRGARSSARRRPSTRHADCVSFLERAPLACAALLDSLLGPCPGAACACPVRALWTPSCVPPVSKACSF